jgi:feruloyl esterase
VTNLFSGHCFGGDGAYDIGQQGADVSTLDPQNNVLLRMVDWVENGNAPETVTGTKYVNVSFSIPRQRGRG